MNISGEMIIGHQIVQGSAGTARAYDPARKEQLEPAFCLATPEDLARACDLADAAVEPYRALPLEQRARFLETIAQRIVDLGPILIERASQESGLPAARLEGERGRTVNQLRLFAKVVRDGHFLEATLDSALPERPPPTLGPAHAQDPARRGCRLRRQQFPARVLGRRRRHRLGPRSRLPGRGQGA